MMMGVSPYHDYMQFHEKLKETFGDSNKQDTRIFEVTMIQQGAKTADEHVCSFRLAQYKSGSEGVALIHKFK
jgi:hypothetical protein